VQVAHEFLREKKIARFVKGREKKLLKGRQKEPSEKDVKARKGSHWKSAPPSSAEKNGKIEMGTVKRRGDASLYGKSKFFDRCGKGLGGVGKKEEARVLPVQSAGEERGHELRHIWREGRRAKKTNFEGGKKGRKKKLE